MVNHALGVIHGVILIGAPAPFAEVIGAERLSGRMAPGDDTIALTQIVSS